MISKADATEAYVWIWLPGETEPVVAGRLTQDGDRLLFTYGASYRERQDAIPIYEPELPLQRGTIAPKPGLSMPSCIRDGSPDAWGRRVIINRLTGAKPDAAGVPGSMPGSSAPPASTVRSPPSAMIAEPATTVPMRIA